MNSEIMISNETEWLFYFMWKKKPIGESGKFSFRIPQTIIFGLI